MVLSLSLLASYLPRLLDVPLLPWPFLLVWGPFARPAGEAPACVGARDRSNHRLTLAYLGGGFAGWQRQINALSVQEVVETALERVVGEPVRHPTAPAEPTPAFTPPARRRTSPSRARGRRAR